MGRRRLGSSLPRPRRPSARKDSAATRRHDRLVGFDLARALAMLGMLVAHTVQYPTLQPKGVLWSVYGRSGPLFVLLAGVGLSLATRSPRRPTSRPRARAMIAVRALLLVPVGMALSTQVDGVILQSYALFFLVGLLMLGLPRVALAVLSAVCLVGGPLLLTVLRRDGDIGGFGSRQDVGFEGLTDPLGFLSGFALDYYPAVTWLGFFFIGMLVGRARLSSPGAGRRLFLGATAATVVAFAVGWAGARAYGPEPFAFSLAPSPPTTWSQHWTTYGFSEAVGWYVSSAALALAVIGAALWLLERSGLGRKLVAPVVALGQMALSFYVLHLLYLGSGWELLHPHLVELGNTAVYFLASLAFWILFAVAAQQWLRFFRRGPLETLLHLVAVAVVRPPSEPPDQQPESASRQVAASSGRQTSRSGSHGSALL